MRRPESGRVNALRRRWKNPLARCGVEWCMSQDVDAMEKSILTKLSIAAAMVKQVITLDEKISC